MKIHFIQHRGENRIKIEFKYNTESIEKLKMIPGCRWSLTHKSWHIPCTEEAMVKPATILDKKCSENIENIGKSGWNTKNDFDTYTSPFVCHASYGARNRYTLHSEFTRAL